MIWKKERRKRRVIRTAEFFTMRHREYLYTIQRSSRPTKWDLIQMHPKRVIDLVHTASFPIKLATDPVQAYNNRQK